MTSSVLITGCSSGIGLDMAFGLRAEGWRVFASCRKQADCDALVAQGFDSPCIDYADPDSICGGLSEVLEATGGTLDALVHNGAYSIPGAVEDLPTDALRAIFEANVFGWHDLTRRVVPVMRAQGRCGAGRIVMISSVLGLVPLPMRGAYVASKFALEGLTDTLRIEMRDTGIDIITVEPGPITSHFRINAAQQFERWIDWRASARASHYERRLMPRLYGDRSKDAFERPASAVTTKVARALQVKRPAPRYYVTTPTYALAFARRVLPTRALDWLIAKG